MPRIAINAKKYAMQDLGACIVDRRRRLGLTQSDIAEKLGISQQQVSYMEKNPGRITQEDMFELNKLLNLDIPQLLKAFGKTTQDIRALAKEYQ